MKDIIYSITISILTKVLKPEEKDVMKIVLCSTEYPNDRKTDMLK